MRRPLLVLAALALAGSSALAQQVAPLDARRARLFGEICATCHVQPGTGAPVVAGLY